ncbi:MAG: YdeI/OmpD-associated family protein [Euzebyaceae bacterium]|nr:YdeI/OmpD-associated family protein [Euzebyaceae bacterium]
MSREPLDHDRTHPKDPAAWAEWLQRNHRRGTGVWLIYWKKHTGQPAMAYDEAVTEALRFGWVDSKARKLDEDRSMLWFAPRRAGSGWSRPNQQRIERLDREGRLAPAGREVVEAARSDGSWHLLDEVENLTVPDDLAEAFDRHAGARDHWDGFPRSARRGILEWIVQAKRPETRAKRVEETARLAAAGERANQWRPGR